MNLHSAQQACFFLVWILETDPDERAV